MREGSFRILLMVLAAIPPWGTSALSQNANFADPNLLPEGFPKTHCRLGPNQCEPVPDSSKEPYDSQIRAQEEKNRVQRAEYLKEQRKKSHDECIKGCDAWFHPLAL